MLKLVIVAFLGLFFFPAAGFSQTPSWDASLTVGLFNGRVNADATDAYVENWYHTGEVRASVGLALRSLGEGGWTEHLKTEFDLAATGEGSRYVTRFGGAAIPYSARDYFRTQQGAARVTWQFLNNSWVQPYVSAGVVLDAEHKRTHVFERYATSTGRVISGPYDEPARMTYQAGASVGAGAKFYVSPRAFIKAGGQAVWTRPTTQVSLFAGMGFDF